MPQIYAAAPRTKLIMLLGCTRIPYTASFSLCIRNQLKQLRYITGILLDLIASFLVRLYGLLRLSNRHLLLYCRAGYRNLSFAVVAVADEQRLPEEIASMRLEYEQVWNLLEARIANSTARNLNSTYICSRPSEFVDDEHAPVYILLNICRVIQLST